MSSAISRIDHVGIYTDRPDQVFRFFTDDLCLPVAFPLTTYPSYTTGSIALGNCFLEITKLYLGDLLGTNLWQRLFLAATRRSTPRPRRRARRLSDTPVWHCCSDPSRRECRS
ncbi:MAG TPA: hypothetical protein VG871_13585 [Vicinamibacterales bacterium]|nr:hypothetical protein [Vicinamibacterales bacterium]